ncbi:MAG TPA: putative selenate ABC transporter substrate-binding protein [Acidimicrobiales bacterium]|nr:putative selenate ABC transporter substrate-binding protein [Acidimicrobiales bacterium]
MSASRSLDVLEARNTEQPGTTRARRPHRSLVPLLLAVALVAAACGSDDDPAGVAGAGPDPSSETFTIGAIPDQDPEVLQRLYGDVADYLAAELGVTVEYVPVTDYAASVSLFRAGDLDMVWFGGLTGVQARLQVEGAEAIVQRDIDENFHSVFIANTASGVEPFEEIDGLDTLAGTRFTFGSESSTSGRLMPQYFLGQAGVSTDDFDGPPGFSGSHDTTIELVEAGTFETGALNEQVWAARTEAGEVDQGKVQVVFRTPAYHDYHWVIRPDVGERFGDGFTDDVTAALVELDPAEPDDAEILELFGAERFIETDDGNYDQIEEVARQLGLVTQ